MGTASVIATHYDFILPINLTIPISHFADISGILNTVNFPLNNSSFFLNDQLQLASSLQSKVLSQIRQINPSYIRPKRGLFNALGSVIKFITGNLDYGDAEKYDKIINSLRNDNSNFKRIASIILNSTDEFQSALLTLQENQQTLESSFKSLFNTTAPPDILQKVAILSTAISSLSTLSSLFETIETAITFAKLNVLHNSILDPTVLLQHLTSISSHVPGYYLPIEPSLSNIVTLEKVFKTIAFSKLNLLTFVVRIPLVERINFTLYKVLPAPVPRNSSFFLIFPTKDYLLLGNELYGLLDSACPLIQPHTYLCDTALSQISTSTAPCEVSLLQNLPSHPNCHPSSVKVSKNIITPVSPGKWIVTMPQPTPITARCDKDQQFMKLKGTHLLETAGVCAINIEGRTLLAAQPTNLQFTFYPLPNISFSPTFVNPIPSLPFHVIKNIHLKQNVLYKELLALKNVVHNPRDIVEYRHVSIYTLSLIILTLAVFIYVILKYFRKKKLPIDTNNIPPLATFFGGRKQDN